MSRYDTFQTTFKNQEALVSALKEQFGDVEVNATPQTLMDWHGHPRPEKAEIIIRRVHVFSMSNDVGFARKKDGSFEAIISDYDKGAGLNAEWMAKLTQSYSQKLLLPHLLRQGYNATVHKTQSNGDVHVTMVRMR